MENVEQHLPGLYMRPAKSKRERGGATTNSLGEQVSFEKDSVRESKIDTSDVEMSRIEEKNVHTIRGQKDICQTLSGRTSKAS